MASMGQPLMADPMAFTLSPRSRTRLKGVHPDLVRVVERAIRITPIDFMVLEGVRTLKTQREYVARGASKTMSSRHLIQECGHACAVDLAPIVAGKVTFKWPPFYPMAAAMKQAAAELDIAVKWGGDWRTFKDGPHFELCRRAYP
jgi:peptidoglycan L-alanyl-D-glutamate endopeptidase CwlK